MKNGLAWHIVSMFFVVATFESSAFLSFFSISLQKNNWRIGLECRLFISHLIDQTTIMIQRWSNYRTAKNLETNENLKLTLLSSWELPALEGSIWLRPGKKIIVHADTFHWEHRLQLGMFSRCTSLVAWKTNYILRCFFRCLELW